MDQQTNTTQFKGKTIQYLSMNEGAAMCVILIHGFPERGHIFENQLAALASAYHVIVPDLPGSGASPYNPLLCSMDDFAEAIKTILDRENIQKAILIGHSMGGYIALSFADKFPASIYALGLLHSTAFADSPEKKANRLKAIKTMEQYGGPAFLKSMIPALFGTAFKAKNQAFIDYLIDQGQAFETSALQQYYQIMHDRTDKTALFNTLHIPYLFISGTEDQAAPKEDLIRQSSLPDTALIGIIPEVGHMGFIEKPDEVNRQLINFLQLTHTLQN